MNGATITSLVSPLAGQQVPAESTIRGAIWWTITGTIQHQYAVIFMYRVPGTQQWLGKNTTISGSQTSGTTTLDITLGPEIGQSKAVAIIADSINPDTGEIIGEYDRREIDFEVVSVGVPGAEITGFSVAVL